LSGYGDLSRFSFKESSSKCAKRRVSLSHSLSLIRYLLFLSVLRTLLYSSFHVAPQGLFRFRQVYLVQKALCRSWCRYKIASHQLEAGKMLINCDWSKPSTRGKVLIQEQLEQPNKSMILLSIIVRSIWLTQNTSSISESQQLAP